MKRVKNGVSSKQRNKPLPIEIPEILPKIMPNRSEARALPMVISCRDAGATKIYGTKTGRNHPRKDLSRSLRKLDFAWIDYLCVWESLSYK